MQDRRRSQICQWERGKRLSAKANAKRAHLELRLGELNREIDRPVDAIAKGHGNPAVLGPRSSVLNEERKQVAMDLNVEPAVNDTISLHRRYWRATSNNSTSFKTLCPRVSIPEIPTQRRQSGTLSRP